MNRIFFVLIICLLTKNIIGQQLNWKHTDGPMGGIVGDIAINSLGEIYAGVYPHWNIYSGLYKSTDNGDSWFKIETQFEDFEVYAIYITKEDHIWVGTNFQGRIYRSTDNGVTWENKRNGYNTGECWAFGQSKDGVIFAGDGQYTKLYRSTDYGENWELSANLRPLVFTTDSNNIVYAGTHDGLFITTDNGLTWAQNNFLANIPVSSILIDSNNNIYCGTGYYSNGHGIFYSRDGGQNWTQMGLNGQIVLSLVFDSYGNIYAGTKYNGLQKTTDLGQTWTTYNKGLYRKEVFRLKLNKQDDIFIGSENEGVFRSTNNGDSFEHIGLPISRVKNIVFSGDTLILTSTPSGVQKYNRITKKWTNLGLQNVEAISITPSDCLYTATFDEGLYKSTNLGETWQLTTLTQDTLMSVYNVTAANDDTVFASTELNLRYTYDGGVSWNISPIVTGFFSRGLFFSNRKSLFSTSHFDSFGQVLYNSTNYALSFDSIYHGFGGAVENNSIFQTDNGDIFFANPNRLKGIIRSTNNGLSWDQILYNKPVVTVFAENNGMVITGFDSIYLSTDKGNNWVSISHNLENENQITDIKMNTDGDLFFATYRTGLYKVDIITSVKDENNGVFSSYQLSQNYPNPFNPITIIKFSMPFSDFVQVKVYDILGKQLQMLVNDYKQAGTYEVEFNSTDLPSGVYFYRMTTSDFSETKKMLLLR